MKNKAFVLRASVKWRRGTAARQIGENLLAGPERILPPKEARTQYWLEPCFRLWTGREWNDPKRSIGLYSVESMFRPRRGRLIARVASWNLQETRLAALKRSEVPAGVIVWALHTIPESKYVAVDSVLRALLRALPSLPCEPESVASTSSPAGSTTPGSDEYYGVMAVTRAGDLTVAWPAAQVPSLDEVWVKAWETIRGSVAFDSSRLNAWREQYFVDPYAPAGAS